MADNSLPDPLSSSAADTVPDTTTVSSSTSTHSPVPVPKDDGPVPTSETLAGFIIRCSELLDQYRDLQYSLQLVTKDTTNVLRPLAQQLIVTTEQSYRSTHDLIDLTMDTVRTKLESRRNGKEEGNREFGNGYSSTSSLSPSKVFVPESPSVLSSSSSSRSPLSSSSPSSSLSMEDSSIPVRDLIPKASIIWLKHLQEEYMTLIVKATIVGADLQTKAPNHTEEKRKKNDDDDDTVPGATTNDQNPEGSPIKRASPSPKTKTPTGSPSSAPSSSSFSVYSSALTDKFYKDIEILCSLSYTGHPQGGMRLPPPGHTRYSWSYPVPWQVRLYRAIVLARETERTFAFREELESEINALFFSSSPFHQYYAYSSSLYYYNFLQILDDKIYQGYIRNIQYNQSIDSSSSSSPPAALPSSLPFSIRQNTVPYYSHHRDIIILGSSIGLLPFYISCSNNVRTIGIDILPIMIQTSYGIALSSGILDSTSLHPSTPSTPTTASSSSSLLPMVQFIQGDAATINPSVFRYTGMVICNSPNWDNRARRTIYSRLLMQCPKDTLIIDYVHPHGILWRSNSSSNSSSSLMQNNDSRTNAVVTKERLAILPLSPTRSNRPSTETNSTTTSGSSSSAGGSKLYEVREWEYLHSKPYDITSDTYQSLYFSKIKVEIWTEEQLQKYSVPSNPSRNAPSSSPSGKEFGYGSSSSSSSPRSAWNDTIIPTSIPKVLSFHNPSPTKDATVETIDGIVSSEPQGILKKE